MVNNWCWGSNKQSGWIHKGNKQRHWVAFITFINSAMLKCPHLHLSSQSLISGSASQTLLFPFLLTTCENELFTEGDLDGNEKKIQNVTLMEMLPKQSVVRDYNIKAWTIKQIWLKALCISSWLPCKVSQSHKNIICGSVVGKAISLYNILLVIILCEPRLLTSAEHCQLFSSLGPKVI